MEEINVNDGVAPDDVLPPTGIHPPSLEQQNPWIFEQLFYLIGSIFTTYGWFILIGGLVAVYLKMKFNPKFTEWLENREISREAADYHKNPDKFVAREREIAEARMRMQLQYDEAAKRQAEILKQKEEKKRQTTVDNWERAQRGESLKEQQQSNSSTLPVPRKENKAKPKLRPEFNPMMDGGSCGWRPSRRGGAAGG